MEAKPIPFEVEINEKTYQLLGNCAIFLYRQKTECSYIRVEDDPPAMGFNNVPLCFFMAGYVLKVDETGDIMRPTVVDNDGDTFRDTYHWSPMIVELEKPNDEIEAAFAETNAEEIDEEWRNFDGTPE